MKKEENVESLKKNTSEGRMKIEYPKIARQNKLNLKIIGENIAKENKRGNTWGMDCRKANNSSSDRWNHDCMGFVWLQKYAVRERNNHL